MASNSSNSPKTSKDAPTNAPSETPSNSGSGSGSEKSSPVSSPQKCWAPKRKSLSKTFLRGAEALASEMEDLTTKDQPKNEEAPSTTPKIKRRRMG
uniref:CXXC-type zinc finger protein 5 n=1 Tax=Panagrellus redivivus TaxID=6233 RepID=A0A7E4VRK7_PANRE